MSWDTLNPFDDVGQLERRIAASEAMDVSQNAILDEIQQVQLPDLASLLAQIQQLQAAVARLEAYATAVSNAIEIGPDPDDPTSGPAVYPPTE